jgi:RimJ/RimL family protein N-acetyltransferase
MRASMRLIGVVESRGWAKALGFLLSRILRLQDDLVFVAEPRNLARPFKRAGLKMLVLTGDNVDWALPKTASAELFAGEAALYYEALQDGDLGFVVLGPGDRLLHSSFVHFAVRTKQLIGEGAQVPLVAYCRTAWAWRAQGLFSETLGHIMAVLSVRGFRRALVTCEAENQGAIHTLEHLGFRRICRLQTLVFMNGWCIQRRSEPGDRGRSRFFTL